MRIPLRNTLSTYASLALSLLFSLAHLKILTTFLSQSDVGLYFVCAGVSLTLGGIYMFGFPLVFSRYIPKYETEGRRDKIQALFWLNVLTFLLAATPTLVVLHVVAARLGDSPVAGTLPAAFLAHGLLFLVSMAASYFAGLRKMHVTALLTVLPLGLHVVLLYVFRQTLTVPLAFHLLSAASIPVLAASILMIRPVFRWNAQVRTEIRRYWGFAVLTSILAPFVLYADRLIIAGLLPLELLGMYMVARRLDMLLRRILAIPLFVMAPELSLQWETPGGTTSITRVFQQFQKLYVLLGVLISVLLALFGKKVILLISTDAYTDAYPVLLILIAGVVVSSVYAPYTLLARSLGKMDLYFYADLTWVISYCLSSPVLIWKLHLLGAAWAVLLASFVTMLFVLTHVRRQLGDHVHTRSVRPSST